MNLLITGVSSGIGRALVENLAREHVVYGISRRDPGVPGINWSHLDLSSPQARKEWLEEFCSKSITLDGLILNAGVGYFDRFHALEREKYESMLETNLMANIDIIHSLLPCLSEKATIIFIGSRASRRFMRGGAVYQASKFGLRGFAGALREEFPQFRVYFLNPSIVRTEFFQNSRTPILGQFPETPMENIITSVRSMLDGGEGRWEVDI